MTVCPPSPTGVTSHLFSHSSVCSDTRLWAAGVPWMSQCQCAELGDVHLRTLTSGFISTPVDVNRKPECTSTCPFPPRHRRGRWSSPCRVVAPTLVGRKLAPVTLNVSTYLVCPSACDWLSSRCYPPPRGCHPNSLGPGRLPPAALVTPFPPGIMPPTPRTPNLAWSPPHGCGTTLRGRGQGGRVYLSLR